MPSRFKMLLLTPTALRLEELRRYADGPCPLMLGTRSYHNASVPIGNKPYVKDDAISSLISKPFDDARWPLNCPCGYVFKENDNWQYNHRHLYSLPDGSLHSIDRSPPGSVWYMDDWPDWSQRKKVDGHSIMIMTPAGTWSPDEPSYANGKCGPGWTRSGTVPDTLTCSPSIRIGDPTRYHGHVVNGWMEACPDSPT